MAKVKFTEPQIQKINEAAAKVERVSSGEVLTALIGESSSYAAPELVFALAGGLVTYVTAAFFYSPISRFLAGMFWTPRDWYATAFIGTLTLLVIALLYGIANIPGFDRLIVPSHVMHRFVRRRALLHFVEAGAMNTRERSGILFFISLREQMVEIIADKGIHSRVEQEVWDGLLAEIVAGIKKGQAAEALEKAILDCAEILKEHFPADADDVNELPDGIVFLED